MVKDSEKAGVDLAVPVVKGGANTDDLCWIVERWTDKGGSKGVSIRDNVSGHYVANMVMQMDDGEMRRAKLIAAAPELLEALRLMREEFAKLPHSLGYEFTHLPKIDAVLAKL